MKKQIEQLTRFSKGQESAAAEVLRACVEKFSGKAVDFDDAIDLESIIGLTVSASVASCAALMMRNGGDAFKEKALTDTSTRDFISSALADVGEERLRQVSEEGYSAARDDRFQDGELALAGACYAVAAADRVSPSFDSDEVTLEDLPISWPLSDMAWKPKSARRDLVRAAALIIAEIERIDRAEDAMSRIAAGGNVQPIFGTRRRDI